MLALYEYTLSGFRNDIFVDELSEAGLLQELQYTNTVGSKVYIYFESELSEPDEATLDLIMASHPSIKIQLIRKVEQIRWEIETGGIMSNGHGIATSDRSKTLANGAYSKVKAEATPDAKMSFKTLAGWEEIDHSVVEQIALDVANHVDWCFKAEKKVTDEINSGAITTEQGVAERFNYWYNE